MKHVDLWRLSGFQKHTFFVGPNSGGPGNDKAVKRLASDGLKPFLAQVYSLFIGRSVHVPLPGPNQFSIWQPAKLIKTCTSQADPAGHSELVNEVLVCHHGHFHR